MTFRHAPPSPHDQALRVALPPGGVPPLVLAAGALALAGGLFATLEARRTPSASPPPSDLMAVRAPSPRLDIPPAPPEPPQPEPPPRVEYVQLPAPPPMIQYIERPAPPPPPPPAAVNLGRLNEPAVLIDLADSSADGATDASARAVRLRGRATLVSQGTLIPAILETPIDTARPGPARALTATDTRGFDGQQVLIPKGSRLVGEVKTDSTGGSQPRAFVQWNRLIRPDGVAIRIASPASDPMGGAGVEGAVDNHTLARVTGVALQTALAIGVNLASRPTTGVVVSIPGQALATAGQSLIPQAELRSSVRVREGAPITVFVNRDLDFSGAALP